MARILQLDELKPHMVVWLQESHVVEPHVTEIVSVKKGKNYFDQECMKVDFGIPFARCFTFSRLEIVMMIMVTLGFVGMKNLQRKKCE